MKERIVLLDYLKGLAIILVVLGHGIYLLCGKNQVLVNLDVLIYVFHMPLFFVVSGYLYRQDFSIKKKARRLLIPYFVWSLPVIFAHIINSNWSDNVLINLFYEAMNLATGGYYWFLLDLFYIFLICKAIFRIVKKNWGGMHFVYLS